jgi:hypothetical protein
MPSRENSRPIPLDGQKLAYVYFEDEPGRRISVIFGEQLNSVSLFRNSSSDKPIAVLNRW